MKKVMYMGFDMNFGSELCSRRSYTNNYRDSNISDAGKPRKKPRVARFAKDILEEQVRTIRERFGFTHGGKKKSKKRRK